MLKNIAKYTTTACLASVISVSAYGELTVNQPMASEHVMKQMPVKMETKAKPMAKQHMHKKMHKTNAKMMKAEPAPMQAAKPVAKPMTNMHHETVVNKPMQSEHMMAKPFKANPEMTPMAKPVAAKMDNAAHDSMCDGKNFFMLKGGVAQPMKFGKTSGIDKKAGATYVAGVAVGRKFMDMMTLSLEYMHRGDSKVTENATTWGAKSDTLMLNTSLALLKREQDIMPYVKLGIGGSRNSSNAHVRRSSRYNLVHNGQKSSSFAWQAGFGINFNYSSQIATVIEYDYVDRGKIKASSLYTQTNNDGNTVQGYNDRTGSLKDHTVTFGIMFKF